MIDNHVYVRFGPGDRVTYVPKFPPFMIDTAQAEFWESQEGQWRRAGEIAYILQSQARCYRQGFSPDRQLILALAWDEYPYCSDTIAGVLLRLQQRAYTQPESLIIALALLARA